MFFNPCSVICLTRHIDISGVFRILQRDGTNAWHKWPNTLEIDIMPPKSVLWWWWWWFPCMSRSISGREACSYYLSLGTKKNNHTDRSDPICFHCFESDFRWYFQWTFLKIKNVGKIKKNVDKRKKRALNKKRKKRFLHLCSKLHTGTFSGQRQGWKTLKRTPRRCTASVCVAGVYC